MPRTPEQYEEIRKEKKQMIMDVALELFASEGFHASSISMIAKKANISKGLMYNYFSSKEMLLNAIIDHGFQKMLANFDHKNDNFITDEEFAFFIETIFDVMENDLHFWKIYFSLMLQSGISDLIARKMEEWYSNVISILIEYFKRKGIEDPETEAFILGSMLDGLGLNFIMNPNLFQKDKIVKKIIRKYISN